jgi:hypothetical protein
MALDLIQRFDISFLVFSRVGSLSVCFFVIEDWWVVFVWSSLRLKFVSLIQHFNFFDL